MFRKAGMCWLRPAKVDHPAAGAHGKYLFVERREKLQVSPRRYKVSAETEIAEAGGRDLSWAVTVRVAAGGCAR